MALMTGRSVMLTGTNQYWTSHEIMDNVKESPGEWVCPAEPFTEEVLLRKLVDHYYGIYLLRLLEGIVHNLNGPMQSLYIRSEQFDQNLAQLQGALEGRKLDAAEELASRMRGRIKGMSKNLDQLNAQVRRLASDLVLERRSEIRDIQVNDVINACTAVLNANMFFKHQVTKTLKLDGALQPIRARRTDVSIIVLNLVQNALEAMADTEDRGLLIQTTAQGGGVIIKIQDTGCGIREEDLKEIYRVCFTTKRGSDSEDAPDSHAGLGLSMVSLLLKDCHGAIDCESRPGKTTFTVKIPAIVDSPES
jgi:signal transduction histidine kinase